MSGPGPSEETDGWAGLLLELVMMLTGIVISRIS